MYVIKRDGSREEYLESKVRNVIVQAFNGCNYSFSEDDVDNVIDELYLPGEEVSVEYIQDQLEDALMMSGYLKVAKAFILYRKEHSELRELEKLDQFISDFSDAENAATGSAVDANSNVSNKNIATMTSELPKEKWKKLNCYRTQKKLKKLYGEELSKQYKKDLDQHIIYKNDASSQGPYCVAITGYPFLLNGLKGLGGNSGEPHSIKSYIGQNINLLFTVAGQFAGAVAQGDFFVNMTWYCVKEWGEDWYNRLEEVVDLSLRHKTIGQMLEDYFQQWVHSINQPTATRGNQACFSNVSYFDKNYFNALFGDYCFPDGTKPDWEGLNTLQKMFMKWFNAERLRTMMTFPVETVALLSNSEDVIDKGWKDFTAEMYSEGHSFFTYISDNADSLSSCCFSGDTKILAKSSNGVHFDSFKNIKSIRTNERKNFTIFHNGSWCSGRLISLPNKKCYKITTANKKQFIISEDHINPTLTGEIKTQDLTTGDYLLFNTNKLDSFHEKDEKLTYEQGFAVGAFLGDGSFGTRFPDGTIYETNYSQNKEKHKLCMEMVNAANAQITPDYSWCTLSEVYNNVYPVRISSKLLVSFIQRWTNWEDGVKAPDKELNMDCLLQSYEFRKGILAGWYNTDGGNSNRCYTTSSRLKDCMEVLITSLGLNSIIDISDRTNEKVIIRGQEFNRNYPLYCVRWYEAGNRRSMEDVYVWKNNSIYFKINSIEEVDYTDNIYCVEMKNTNEPYFTLPNGLITHNCRLRNKVQANTFNFTNGNVGIATGSKSVITLNLNRIVQDWANDSGDMELEEYLIPILERVYKYHTAYNELLKDFYAKNMLTVYSAGFIDLKKQFLTIGLNGINEAAMFLGLKCNDNEDYCEFINLITSTITAQNTKHRTKELSFNTEFVPAEGLGPKNYKWDKEDGYIVPEDRNCYTSYFFLPDDPSINIIEKFKLHGKRYVENLDGGQAAHINLQEHLSKEQYLKLIELACKEGTNYFTFNVPNSECDECGYITKHPIDVCPKCGSDHIIKYDRIIGYLTAIKNWEAPRKIEQNKRIYELVKENI